MRFRARSQPGLPVSTDAPKTPNRTGIWPKTALFGLAEGGFGPDPSRVCRFRPLRPKRRTVLYLAENSSFWPAEGGFGPDPSRVCRKALFFGPQKAVSHHILGGFSGFDRCAENAKPHWYLAETRSFLGGGFGPDSRAVYQIGPFRARFQAGLPISTAASKTPNRAGIWPKSALFLQKTIRKR